MRGTIAGVVAVLLMTAATDASALTIHHESFETAPGAGYTLSNQFDDGAFDYFGRYAVPDVGNGARNDYITGWDGNYGIMGQDHDGTGASATQSVSLSGIDISGFNDLSVRLSLGALNSEPNFTNFESGDGDGIRVWGEIDGGGQTLLGAFLPPNGDGDLRLDTNNDGIGDGTILTVALTGLSFSLSGTGSSLSLVIEMTSTESFESLALDNVRVMGTQVVPLPAALPLLMSALGFFGLFGWRRKRMAAA